VGRFKVCSMDNKDNHHKSGVRTANEYKKLKTIAKCSIYRIYLDY